MFSLSSKSFPSQGMESITEDVPPLVLTGFISSRTRPAGEDSTSHNAGVRAGLVRELMTSVGMKGGTSSRPNKTVQIEYPEK